MYILLHEKVTFLFVCLFDQQQGWVSFLSFLFWVSILVFGTNPKTIFYFLIYFTLRNASLFFYQTVQNCLKGHMEFTVVVMKSTTQKSNPDDVLTSACDNPRLYWPGPLFGRAIQNFWNGTLTKEGQVLRCQLP